MSHAPNTVELFTETEPIYSNDSGLTDITEWKRRNTNSMITDNQLGLIPTWMDGYTYQKTDTYFKNGRYETNRAWFTTVVTVEGLMNILMLDEQKDTNFYDHDNNSMRYYKLNMIDAYNQKRCSAFLLFVNKVFIPWSRITIVRSDRYYTLMITEMDKDLPITSFDILHIPFKVEYDEEYNETTIRNLFSFDETGRFTIGTAKYHIGIPDDNQSLESTTFHSNSFALFDTGIDPKINTTPDNYFVFTSDGLMNKTESVEAFNRNLLTTGAGSVLNEYVVAIWDSRSNRNEAMTMRSINSDFAKRLVRSEEGIVGLEVAKLDDKFEFKHSSKMRYIDNLSNSKQYLFNLDHNKFDKAFMDIKNINVVEYGHITPVNGTITMLRDVYDGDNYETFPIIFIDGLADSDCNNSIVYTPDSFTFRISNAYTDLTIIYFKKVDNRLLIPKISGNNLILKDSAFVNIDCVTPVIASDSFVRPLKNHIDGTNIVLDGTYRPTGTEYIGLVSKYQFHHMLSITPAPSHKINLNDEFKCAYDKNKFLVFINGRLLNSIFYEPVLPSMVRYDDIQNKAIYFRNELEIGDKVDIYYVSSVPLTEANVNGDLLINCIKTKATYDGQQTFKVPYPFKNYPHIYDGFFCIKNSSYVDKSRYVFDGDNITFTDPDDKFFFAQDLVFVFPYYRPDWDNDDEVSAASAMHFHYYPTRTGDKAVSTVDFTPDYRGTPNGATYLFIDTTYISPLRYTLTGSTVTFLNGETVKPNTMVTLVVETDKDMFKDNNVVLDPVLVTATEDTQYVFDIPEPDYYDSFFIMKGSVILAPNRYFVTADKKILLTDKTDYVPKGRNIQFIFVRKGNDVPANYTEKGLIHLKTDYMIYRPSEKCKSFKIPTNYFHRFRFNENNMLMWSNSVFYDNDRYTIQDNVITLINDDDYFYTKSLVVVMIAYETLNYNTVEGDLEEKDIIYFEDVDVPMRNGAKDYYIPWPNPPFTDTAFMVSIGGTFIQEEEYDINGDVISFKSSNTRFEAGHKIRFTFVHNKDFTCIVKKEGSTPLTAGQTEVDIPSPFNKVVNLNRRMIVTYGGVYLDRDRYLVDNVNRKLLLIDIAGEEGRDLHFYFFYTGNKENGAVAFLPESGYFYFRSKHLDRNINKEMMMVFVNGKLIPKSSLLDITNNLHKITTDIRSRYDFTVFNCAPAIKELQSEYEKGPDLWSNFIDEFPIVQK